MLVAAFHLVAPIKTGPDEPVFSNWQFQKPNFKRAGCRRSAVHLERGNEGFLRDLNLAELTHLLLTSLLLIQ